MLLVALVLAVFGQIAGNGFVNFDDGDYVKDNAMVSSGLSLKGIEGAFTHVVSANWHPLTMIFHMLDCQLYGLWPGGHHLTSIFLHAACAVFLFLLLQEMTGALWRSGFVAAVFAIHPLRVESVAWIAELKDVLSGLLFMLTLRAYVRYARQPEIKGRYWMVILWFVLGLLSKPMLVTVPFVLLLLDYWPLRRLENRAEFGRLLGEKWPLFVLSALSCVVTVCAQKQVIKPISALPFSTRIGNAVVAYAVYIWKFIYPSQLSLYYPLARNGPEAWQVMDASLLLVVMSAGAFLLRRRQPWLLVGWLWYLGMLVPVIGILQVGEQAYADRYTYLPQIGLCFAGTWLAADWAGQHENRRLILAGIAVVILCVLAFAGWRQTTYWHSNEILWTHALECTRDNYVAHGNLGSVLREQGRTEEAALQYREAAQEDPGDPDVHYNLGNALLDLGRLEEAIAEFREALQIKPSYVDARSNLGVALFREGRPDQAIAEYREVLRIDPSFADAHSNLGDALSGEGRPQEAIAEYREALRINPAYAGAHYNLGNALLEQGHTDEAIAEYRNALRINPAYADARNNLGMALGRQGRVEEAIAEYREGIRINPADGEAHFNLGNALLEQGNADGAIAEYRAALRANPGYAAVHGNLGVALLHTGSVEQAIAEFTEALRANPADAGAHGNLGLALFQQGKSDKAVAEFREALKIDPSRAEAHFNLGNALLEQGQTAQAITEVQKALEAQPANATIQDRLAWMLATAPEKSLRNGARAVQLATQASQTSGGMNFRFLRTLAAADAQAGEFSTAVQTAQRALQMAESTGNFAIANALVREIKLYEAARPFEEAH